MLMDVCIEQSAMAEDELPLLPKTVPLITGSEKDLSQLTKTLSILTQKRDTLW
jgi:hypothetical protein